jgi:hypothetical protein
MNFFGLILGVLIVKAPAVVEIYINNRDIIPVLKKNGIEEIVKWDQKKGILEVVCDKKLIDYLEKHRIVYTTKIPDLGEDFKIKMLNYINFGPYYTFSEAEQELFDIHNDYPNLTTHPDTIGWSHESRPIYAMKISDNPYQSEGEPVLLLTGIHHAREPIGCTIVLEFAKYLLSRYGTDPDITWLIDNRELWIVPVMNPDGYTYNEIGDGYWRKNKRDNNNNGQFEESYDGVDLNRNYGYMWGYDDQGSSPDPSSQIYRGPYAFSEPETETIRQLCNQIHPVVALNYHSYSNLLLYPWGYDDYLTPDDALFDAMAEIMTSASGYQYGTAWELLYNANGTSDDWMYGEQTEKPKIMAFTPEVGEAFWQPDTNTIIEQFNENLPMNMFALKTVGHYIEIDSFHIVDQNGSTQIDPGDTVNMTLWIKNLGIQGNLTNVVGILSSSGNCAIMIDSIRSFPDVPAFPGDAVSNSLPFVFWINPQWADTTVIPITLEIEGDPGYSKYYSFYIGEGISEEIFYDGFETGLSAWIQGGSPTNWDTYAGDSYAGQYSLTDSPASEYSNNSDTWIRTVSSYYIDSSADSVFITFWIKYFIESGYDYLYVEVSTDGNNWNSVKSFTGTQSSWEKVKINITNYKGNNIYVRFRLYSDWYITDEGAYIDEVKIESYRLIEGDCPTKIVEKGTDIRRDFIRPKFFGVKELAFVSNYRGNYRIEIYTTAGTKVFYKNIFLERGDVFKFKPENKGVYFFTIKTGVFEERGKIIVTE